MWKIRVQISVNITTRKPTGSDTGYTYIFKIKQAYKLVRAWKCLAWNCGSFNFVINGWMRIELEGIWKESTAVYFQAIFTAYSGGTEETHEKFCLDKWSREDKIWNLDFPMNAHERWKTKGQDQFCWHTIKRIFNILYTVARCLLYVCCSVGNR